MLEVLQRCLKIGGAAKDVGMIEVKIGDLES